MKKILFWIFSAALLAGGTIGAVAQAGMAKKAAAVSTVGRAMGATELAQGQAMQAKAAAAGETSTSVLRRAATVGHNFPCVNTRPALVAELQQVRALGMAKSPAKATVVDGNVTLTTGDGDVILNVEGVDSKYYDRATTGVAYYVSNGSMAIDTQSGIVEVKEDGDNVYIKDIVSRYNQGSWVKGVKNGNTITVAARQPLAYSTNYMTTISLRWGMISGEGSIEVADSHADSFVFAIDGNTLTLEGTAGYEAGVDTYYMGVYWDDDNSNTGYGDAETVLTYDEGYVPPSTDPVELPDGAVVENWYLNGYQVIDGDLTSVKNREAYVAFVGSDVYVAFSKYFETWMKGSVEGSAVVFDSFQYAGNYYGYDCWYVGLNLDTEELCNPEAVYDAEAKTITFTNDLLVNAATDRVYCLEWYDEPVLSADEVAYEEPVLTTLTAELPYSNSFQTEAEQAQVAIFDANEDGKTFSFYEQVDGNIIVRCVYNSTADMDDYVVFPGIALEAGKNYRVSVDAAAYSSSYPERIEVVAGPEAKVSQLTLPVIDPTELTSSTFATLINGEFAVETSGTYYFAIHGISDADQLYLMADNFSVTEVNPNAPEAIEDLAVVTDPSGANKATVTLTVPSANLAGAALSGDVDIIVNCDGQEVYNQASAPGAAVSFEVNVETPGFYNFTAVAKQDDAVSETAKLEAYIGVDTPVAVADLSIADHTTSVALAWTAPAAGANDGILLPEDVTYNVYPVEIIEFWGFLFPEVDYDNPYATGLTETHYDIEFNTCEGEMGYTYFAVTAQNAAGESNTSMNALITGEPAALPMMESFANQTLTYFWTSASDNDNYYNDGGVFFSDASSDGDGNCLLMDAVVAGWINLESGKVNLAGAANPMLSFDCMADKAASLTVYVVSQNGKEALTTLAPGTAFAPVSLSLAQYAAEPWIRIEFYAEFSEATELFIDNVRVLNQLDKNMSIVSYFVPATMKMGVESAISATVANYGSAEAAGATLDLVKDGQVVESKELEALAPFASSSVSFAVTPDLFSADHAVYSLNLNYEGDEDASDNATPEVSVVVRPVSSLPVVTDLAGSNVAGGVQLVWSEPNLDGSNESVCESFDSGEAFAQQYEGWTFVDVDASPVGGFQSLDIPGIEPGVNCASYFVFECSEAYPQFNDYFAAHTGDRYLAALFRYDDGTSDDWAISPVLSGDAQTVTFYAKSYSGDYPEKIEVYVGNGTEVSDFTAANLKLSVAIVPEAWTQYSFDVPEGFSHFAVRSCATGSFMLMLDDFEFVAAASTSDLSIVGYDVYRDGAKLTAEPTGENNYLDASAEEGLHSYNVVVVYNKGISPISNTAEVLQAAGLQALEAGVSVAAVDGAIVVKGAQGKQLTVSAVNGVNVFAAKAAATVKVPVSAGVYLVQIDSKVVKVIVK